MDSSSVVASSSSVAPAPIYMKTLDTIQDPHLDENPFSADKDTLHSVLCAGSSLICKQSSSYYVFADTQDLSMYSTLSFSAQADGWGVLNQAIQVCFNNNDHPSWENITYYDSTLDANLPWTFHTGICFTIPVTATMTEFTFDLNATPTMEANHAYQNRNDGGSRALFAKYYDYIRHHTKYIDVRPISSNNFVVANMVLR